MTLFPYKLHELLSEMQANAHLSSIISWMPSGNAFKIHQPELFEAVLLQKYFPRQTQINSFKRQLLYYGFDNLGDCVFAHPCFLKDKRHLCGQITHTNPTKSQREANASIPSRRVRGKRAKQALRQSLADKAKAEKNSKKGRTTPCSPVNQQPIASPQVGALPLAPPAPLAAPTSPLLSAPTSPLLSAPVMMNDAQAALSLQQMQMLLQGHNIPFLPSTTTAATPGAEFSTLLDALAQNKGLPLTNMFTMSYSKAGLHETSTRHAMPQPYGAMSSSRVGPPSA
ncbi:unnamed protein product [Cylindrotheca closterium]|uniref:HSF-type DNA-binding domain-containing protein n=1 Tax=Cylindrotheca closterium TaxID=2856 RepID=A0AAD2FEC6_9STRA|nr:unnamed protein product [Cylindrotheca closterium]